MQFWYHTQHMGKLGILEYIIVTPSHHRVHHAINPEYLDKNLSQIFIVWDFLFGTFQLKSAKKEIPNNEDLTQILVEVFWIDGVMHTMMRGCDDNVF